MTRSPEHSVRPSMAASFFCPVSWRTSGFQSVSRGLCAGGWRTRLWTTTFSSCKSVALCLWKAPHTALFESNNTRAIRTQHLNAFWLKRMLLNCTSKRLITPHTCNNNHPCSLGLDWDVYTTWEGVLNWSCPDCLAALLIEPIMEEVSLMVGSMDAKYGLADTWTADCRFGLTSMWNLLQNDKHQLVPILELVLITEAIISSICTTLQYWAKIVRSLSWKSKNIDYQITYYASVCQYTMTRMFI